MDSLWPNRHNQYLEHWRRPVKVCLFAATDLMRSCTEMGDAFTSVVGTNQVLGREEEVKKSSHTVLAHLIHLYLLRGAHHSD